MRVADRSGAPASGREHADLSGHKGTRMATQEGTADLGKQVCATLATLAWTNFLRRQLDGDAAPYGKGRFLTGVWPITLSVAEAL